MDLSQFLGVGRRLRRDNAVGWVLRLSKALVDLHDTRGAHGCVCPEAVKTAGPACQQQASLRAPEGLQSRRAYHGPERGAAGPASAADDVWAAGVVLYEALTGALPFASAGQPRPARPLAGHGCGDQPLQAVLDRVFHEDPRQRVTTAQALVVLLHPLHSEADRLPPLDLAPALDIDDPETVDETEQRDSEDMFLGWLGQDAPVPAEQAQAARPGKPMVPGLGREETAPAAQARGATTEGGPVSQPRDPREPVSERRPEEPTPSAEPSEPTPSSRAAEAEAEAEAEAAAPAPARRRRSTRQLVQIVAAVAILAVAYLVLKRPAKEGPAPAPLASHESASTAAAAATEAAPAPTAPRATSTATAVASSAASVTPPAAPPLDRDRCVPTLFAAGTFAAETPSFAWACDNSDPRQGAKTVKREVVLARHGNEVSDGMREWSLLGWYELAAFAVMHGRCCQDPLKLDHPAFQICDMGAALGALHQAAKSGASTDAAVERYAEAARCAWRSKYADPFSQKAQPTLQQLATFGKTLARVGGGGK